MPWYSHTHTTGPLAAAIEPPTFAGRLERAWALQALIWSASVQAICPMSWAGGVRCEAERLARMRGPGWRRRLHRVRRDARTLPSAVCRAPPRPMTPNDVGDRFADTPKLDPMMWRKRCL